MAIQMRRLPNLSLAGGSRTRIWADIVDLRTCASMSIGFRHALLPGLVLLP